MGAGRMKPPSFSPMVVMKSPMPTPMARLRLSGMAFMTASRRPVSTRMRMMRPSTKITDMPTCQGTFACWKPMTEKVTHGVQAHARGQREGAVGHQGPWPRT